MEELAALLGNRIVYHGPEGLAVIHGDTEELSFHLDCGGPIQEGTLRPDGSAVLVRFKPIKKTSLSTRMETPYAAEAIEPVKAFLRSKGVRLPHLKS